MTQRGDQVRGTCVSSGARRRLSGMLGLPAAPMRPGDGDCSTRLAMNGASAS